MAAQGIEENPPTVDRHISMASIAISMKRVADSLDYIVAKMREEDAIKEQVDRVLSGGP